MSDDFVIDLSNITKTIKGSGPIVVVDDDPSQIQLVEICYKKSEKKTN